MKRIYHNIQLAYARIINRMVMSDNIVFIPEYLKERFEFPMNACSSGFLGRYYFCELKDVPEKLLKLLVCCHKK